MELDKPRPELEATRLDLLHPHSTQARIVAHWGGNKFFNTDPVKSLWTMTVRCIEIGAERELLGIPTARSSQLLLLEATKLNIRLLGEYLGENELLASTNEILEFAQRNLVGKSMAPSIDFPYKLAQLLADQIDAIAQLYQMHPTDVREMAKVMKIHLARDQKEREERAKGIIKLSGLREIT